MWKHKQARAICALPKRFNFTLISFSCTLLEPEIERMQKQLIQINVTLMPYCKPRWCLLLFYFQPYPRCIKIRSIRCAAFVLMFLNDIQREDFHLLCDFPLLTTHLYRCLYIWCFVCLGASKLSLACRHWNNAAWPGLLHFPDLVRLFIAVDRARARKQECNKYITFSYITLYTRCHSFFISYTRRAAFQILSGSILSPFFRFLAIPGWKRFVFQYLRIV